MKNYNIKNFVIDANITLVGMTRNTRNGFLHEVEYRKNGCTIASAKCSYINRTWESFDYESAIDKLLRKMEMSEQEQKRILAICSGKAREESDKMFGSLAAIASLGEIFANTPKEKNDWKVRMLKAGLPGLDVPDDWDTLSEEEKSKRLDKVIAEMKPKKVEA